MATNMKIINNPKSPNYSNKQFKEMIEIFRKQILGNKSPINMCHIVCQPMIYLLRRKEIQCELSFGLLEFNGEGYEHFWITLNDKTIIDPTASQFNSYYKEKIIPKIFIGKKPNWYFEYDKNLT